MFTMETSTVQTYEDSTNITTNEHGKEANISVSSLFKYVGKGKYAQSSAKPGQCTT